MKTATLKDYKPHANQQLFHKSKDKDAIIISSVRAGKTYAIMHQVIKDAGNNPTEYPILIVAPTRQQLTDIIFRPLFYKLLDYGLCDIKSGNKSENIIQLNNGKLIYGRSAEAYERIRGLTLYKIFVDEAALVPKECIDICKSRLLTTKGNLILATTPRGKNNGIYEDYFANNIKRENIDYFKFQITDNPEIDIKQVNQLRQQYSPLLAKQELDGEFVSLYENRIYPDFNDNNIITDYNFNLNSEIYIGIDGNINIYAAIVAIAYNNNVYIIDEFSDSKDVPELANKIIRKYGKTPYIITDAMNSQSNRLLLKQAGLNRIIETKSNPARIDRYNHVNAGIKNASNESHLYVMNNCSNIIKDLQTLEYKKGTDQANDMNNTRGHGADALGYLLYNQFKINPYTNITLVDDMLKHSAHINALFNQNNISTQSF